MCVQRVAVIGHDAMGFGDASGGCDLAGQGVAVNIAYLTGQRFLFDGNDLVTGGKNPDNRASVNRQCIVS